MAAVAAALTAQGEVAFEDTPEADEKRLLAYTKERYWNAGLTSPLVFGEVASHALPYQSYAKALTDEMLHGPLDDLVDGTVVVTEGGYEDIESDDDYWAKSGVQHFDPAAFYLVDTVTDVFGNETSITYDSHKLFAIEVENALALTVQAEIDYRVLAPKKVTDPNLNFVEAGFDALGRVVATATAGAHGEGDTLAEPTTRMTYELARYALSGEPVRVTAERRETHADEGTRWLVAFSYSDGSGNEVMAKVQAEPGPVPGEEEDADPRWVGTGRTVFDNKGNPIKQYEPYFSATEEYEDDAEIVETGVTPILHYDPLGRLVRTDFPDGTYARVDIAPWSQTTWDGNDTADVGQLWFDAAPTAPERVKANAHAGTPTVAYFDALGRTFAVREHNKIDDDPPDEYLITKSVLDVQGNVLAVVDALDRTCMTYVPNMIGQVLAQTSIDAGSRRIFATAAGEPVKGWGERGFTQHVEYDDLRRRVRVYVDDGTNPEILVERLVYGETHDDASDNYTKGRLVQHYDQAGVLVSDRFDFKGNLLEQVRRYAVDYQNAINWADAGNDIEGEDDPEDALVAAGSALEAETFGYAYAYDALDRPTSITTPDSSEVLPGYNIAGLLESVAAHVRGAGGSPTAFITNIDYDEKGRRQKIEYANGTETTYEYDPLTFRLTHFKTERLGDDKLLQSLSYTYDAVGNIVSTHDSADHEVYFSATTVASADQDLTYDAVYRLLEAKGREHEAGTSSQLDDADYDSGHVVPHPNDPSGLRRYTQTYAYDLVGNITSFQHAPASGSGGFTRAYTYVSGTNRLATTSFGGGTIGYSHDAAGNMDALPHLSALVWDYAERLKHVEKTSGQDVYFVYDAAGTRVRKVFVHGSIVEDRRYVGGYEVYRKSISSTLEDERETLHIADDRSRVCMVETLTVEGGSAVGTPTPRYRYQLDNHLGTVSVEVDESGAVISYEEYHPYGTSAYRAFQGEVSAKRYRYIGCERDDETGLYLMGARYYAAWLGRWTAADPMGTVDGPNLFAYVRGSPVGLRDPEGTKIDDQTGDDLKGKYRDFLSSEEAKERAAVKAAHEAAAQARAEGHQFLAAMHELERDEHALRLVDIFIASREFQQLEESAETYRIVYDDSQSTELQLGNRLAYGHFAAEVDSAKPATAENVMLTIRIRNWEAGTPTAKDPEAGLTPTGRQRSGYEILATLAHELKHAHDFESGREGVNLPRLDSQGRSGVSTVDLQDEQRAFRREQSLFGATKSDEPAAKASSGIPARDVDVTLDYVAGRGYELSRKDWRGSIRAGKTTLRKRELAKARQRNLRGEELSGVTLFKGFRKR